MKSFLSVLCLLLSIFVHAQNQIPLTKSDSASVQLAITSAEKVKPTGDIKEESRFYDQIAYLYWEHNFFQLSVEWYERSLALNERLSNQSGVSMINSNLGLIYADLRNFEKSLAYFQKVLDYRRMAKDNLGMITTQINMSVVLNNLHRYDESAKLLENALSIAREMNDVDQMKSCYGMLSETYERAKQADKAKFYFEMYRTFHEKQQKDKDFKNKKLVEETQLQLQLSESEKRIKEMALLLTSRELKNKEQELVQADSTQKQLYSNLSKSELKNQLLQRDNEIKDINIQKQNIIEEKQRFGLIFMVIIILLFIVLAIILIFGYKQKQKAHKILTEQFVQIEIQKNEIEVRKKRLTDSIRYAHTIQTAMFKRNAKLENLVADYFVLYRPKDVVSGDFYWFAEIDEVLILVLADCTGHGVPGAFMSMLGMNLLNHIVEFNHITSPELILHELNSGIRFALSQEENKNKDGMDMTICTIDRKQNKIYYAGAQRPLVIVQDNIVNSISASKAPVGGMNIKEIDRKYELNTFELLPNTHLYFYSDGYTDQFHHYTKKKFSSKRLLELITNNHKLSAVQQKEIFETELNDWQQSHYQLDDITLIYVKV